MSQESIDERSRRAAHAARAWAASESESRLEAVLGSVRQEATLPAASSQPTRRTPLLLVAASLAIGAVIGAAIAVDRSSSGDVIVPVDTPVDDTTAAEPSTTERTNATLGPNTDEQPPSSGGDPVDVDPNAAPVPREFVVDLSDIDVQDTFPVAEAVLGMGSGAVELGPEDQSAPLSPSLLDDVKFVVSDPANGRVQVIDWYGVEVSREQIGGDEFGSATSDGELPGLFPALSLPIQVETDTSPPNISVGQPVIAPSGEEIFVPVASSTGAAVTIQRFVRGVDFPWEFAESIVSEIEGLGVDDEFVVAGRSLLHTASGNSVYDFTEPDTPFTPIVRAHPDGWSSIDERGVETMWHVEFSGTATGLADGSVVIAGTRTDGNEQAESTALLLRLWSDGTTAMSRFAASRAGGAQRVTADGGSTLTTTDDGDWLLEQWPLPDRAMDPPTRPDQDIGSCDGVSRTVGSSTRQADGYLFPWTVSGGPAGDNGAYVAVYDALGRTVLGGGCSSMSNPPERLEIRGASYRTYGDSIIVAIAEPLSLGGVSDVPEWLGEPIAEGIVESLASEVEVYRVPEDRELPTADEENTFLLVQVRAARRIRIESGGIGVHVPPEDIVPVPPDPFDLRSTATEFAQGYLDALAEERWEDAVTYIANDGRSWEDRPAFADLYALVGDEVGTAAALARWCTEERDCTRGVANGVLEQVSDTQVNVAITFEVPGGPMFERTINPLWTVGWFEGGLYVDGLPQVTR